MNIFRHVFLISMALIYSCYATANDPKILEVRTGDIILLPLDCFSCRMIADEEETKFSHSGVALVDAAGKISVVEALGKVRAVTLEEFLQRTAKSQHAILLRSHELDQLYTLDFVAFKEFQSAANILFTKAFAGLPFDHDYLWDNYTPAGLQKLYCSEFVAKFLNHFLRVKITPTAMDFSRNWDFWMRYFNGNVPQGKLGNSPGSFKDSKLFYQVRIFQ